MEPLNRKALEYLHSVSDANATHSVLHFLYFPTGATALAADSILKHAGIDVETDIRENEESLVLVRMQLVPTEANMDDICDSLRRFATENGGSYDGWDAGVVKRKIL